MKIYTKSGDHGTTSLIGGERVPKYDAHVEAYGSIDELSAHIAMLYDLMSMYGVNGFGEDFLSIQKDLMMIEAILASGERSTVTIADIAPSRVEHLEKRIDELSIGLPAIDKFTIPGGHIVVSESHICRTVCRRAERKALMIEWCCEKYPNSYAYMNRLSDYLYTLGRVLGLRLGVAETLWEP